MATTGRRATSCRPLTRHSRQLVHSSPCRVRSLHAHRPLAQANAQVSTTTSTASSTPAAAAAEAAGTQQHGATSTKPASLSLQLEVVRSISEVPAAEWDAVAMTALPAPARRGLTGSPSAAECPSEGTAEYEVNPFVLHAFLSALETSGSVGRRRGWVPCHLVVRQAPATVPADEGVATEGGEDHEADAAGGTGAAAANGTGAEDAAPESAAAGAEAKGEAAAAEDEGGAAAGPGQALEAEAGTLLGCCPLYMKGHSQGEYVFDHSWADLSHQLGKPYYPKLQCAVPFTPCPGPRLMVRGDLDEATRRAVMQALGQGLIQVAQSTGMSSVHVTFCTAEEWGVLAELGYIQRMGIQFHWDNKGPYKSFEGFLSALKQSKRATIRKERKSVAKQGLKLKALSGADIQPHHWDRFYEFYLNTIDRYDSYAYLTKEFFQTVGKTMPEHVLLVVAEEEQAAGKQNAAVSTSGSSSREGSSGSSSDLGSSDGGGDELSVDGTAVLAVEGVDEGAKSAGDSQCGSRSEEESGSRGADHPDAATASAATAIAPTAADTVPAVTATIVSAASNAATSADEQEQQQEQQEQQGGMVAAAFNMLGSHALFGRNWGCVADREFRNLHFEASYYQAIEQACERGLQRVEAGAQGMHKLQRGYMPSLTYSAHYLLDPTLRHVVARAMQTERSAMLRQLQGLSLEGSPYKDEATLELLTRRVQAHFASVSSMSSSSDEEDGDGGDEGGATKAAAESGASEDVDM